MAFSLRSQTLKVSLPSCTASRPPSAGQSGRNSGGRASAPGQEIRTEVFSEGRVSVRDFGKGIRPEELEKIREPFYTADPARKSGRGLGLGLAICEQIVRLHGAGLRIESSEGEGTEASVVFDLQFVYGTMKNSGTGSGTLETGKEELP